MLTLLFHFLKLITMNNVNFLIQLFKFNSEQTSFHSYFCLAALITAITLYDLHLIYLRL